MKTKKTKWPAILIVVGVIAMYLHARPTAPVKPVPANIVEGTSLELRLERTVSSSHSIAGETFTGKLAKAIVANGQLIAPEGTEFRGKVIEASPAGYLAGGARLRISLTSFSL